MTKTEIANAALSVIGQPHITGLEEQSEPARQIRTHFSKDMESLLSAHDWTFATAFEKLAIAANVDMYKFSKYRFAYVKPDGCLRIRRVKNPKADLSYKDGTEVGMEFWREVFDMGVPLILSNVPDAILEFIRINENTATWDPIFCDALIYKLATSIVGTLTGSTDKIPMLTQQFNNALQTAKMSNVNNENIEQIKPTRLIHARFRR